MNILLLVVVQNTLAILAASHLGYILSHVAALTAVLWLRTDRPRCPGAIKPSSFWIASAGVLAAAYVVFISSASGNSPIPATPATPNGSASIMNRGSAWAY